MSSRVSVHGNWAVDMLPDVPALLQKGQGTWSAGTAQRYVDEVKEYALQLAGSPWVAIGYGLEWDLGVPAVEAIVRSLANFMAEQGCVLNIIVVQRAVSQSQLQKMLTIDNYELHFTVSLDEVYALAEPRGFNIPHAQVQQFIDSPYPNR